ncbi:cell division protein SepF [Corynebacterium anserum]|uniref:Cell division protein SepF n=1 Tax=Corynebacterium anserum TaxID=2684406 RepID=A0A7G7YMZ2_9CORY|nr:cell division protein SepF [Corynebacterium anserum]MBC2680906.1 cell division protein SepF [Corynebacterium anserum]QNH95862.1 cell division protein SepF [Corynebacterium anserum]
MSDSFSGKVKDFFGFGEVDNYRDPYYGDSFREERDGRDERGSDDRSRDRDPGDDRYYSRGASSSSYRDYGASHRGSSSRYGESAARPSTLERRTVAPEPQVVRLSLSEYNQASELVEIIKSGDVAVFNLGGMEKNQAARVLDFASGLAKGVDATIKKLRGVRNFVLIPQGLTLEQSQLDQLVEDL